jgi:hypothetical protein
MTTGPDTSPKLQDVIAEARQNLNDAKSRELEDLFTKYGDIFVMNSDDYRQTDRFYHCIDKGDARAICQPPRRIA